MIEFQFDDGISLPGLDQGRVFRWLHAVAGSHGHVVGDICYRFCDDAQILETNRQFLGHDYFTDIITFDYSHDDKIAGDIYLSLVTVATNAEELGEPYRRELMRVIAHGVLHLCGINDKGPGEREIMERAENAALELWKES